MWFSIVILRSMSSMFKSSQSRHSYPFCNISNSHFSLTPLSSPFSNTFSTGFKSEKQERHDKHDKHDKHNK